MPVIASLLASPCISDAMTEPDMMLVLARHGRTAWNRAGRYQGRSDPPLSAEGRSDAIALAARLAGTKIATIVASPLQRAGETAAIVAERLGIDRVRVDSRLAEIAYGTWEGFTQAEVKARWPDDLRRWKRTPDAMRFPGGETLAEARARLLQALADLAAGEAALRGSGAVLVVTHGGLIRLALIEARRLDIQRFRDIPVEPCAFHRLALCRGDGVVPSLRETLEDFLCVSS